MQIQKYNLDDIKKNKPDIKTKENFIRMAIVGPSDSGKTYLFKYIAKKVLLAQYDLIVVFCGSEDTRMEYARELQTEFIYPEYRPDVIKLIKQVQSEVKKPNTILVVYDDYATRNTKYNKELFDLAISGRHSCISFVMILHDLVCLDRIVRDNLTHMIVTRQQAQNVYETLAKEYLWMTVKSEMPDATDIKVKNFIVNLLHNTTGNYNMIILCLQKIKKEPNKTLSDYVYQLRAC